MIISVKEQLLILMTSVFSGIILGFLLDSYTILRTSISEMKLIKIFSDISFWILAAVLMFCILLKTNSGFLGLYITIYFGIGFLLYKNSVSKFYISIATGFIRGIIKCFRMLFNLLIYSINIILYKINGNLKK